MSLERIIDKIIDDANIAASSLHNDALTQAKQIMNRAKIEAENSKAKIIQEAKQEAQMRTNRILAAAELEGRKQELAAFQQTVEKCFALAVDKLVRLKDADYQQLIDKMVKAVQGSEKMELIQIPKEEKGGFLLKNGDVTLNFSFAALAKNSKEKLEQNVVKILGW